MDAEKLLLDEPKGAYLVRVSEKVWGYTISYRAIDRCKHFLIDASEDQYHFFGPNQLMHDSIIELVNYHKVSYLSILKDIHFCPIEIIKGLTNKGQFQYLTQLKGPQEGTYLFTTQLLSLR